MRASLPHTLRERRRSRADQHKHGAAKRDEAPDHTPDLDVMRVRSAGGPVDMASYSCACGCIFMAPVSTTVACPRCNTPQAW